MENTVLNNENKTQSQINQNQKNNKAMAKFNKDKKNNKNKNQNYGNGPSLDFGTTFKLFYKYVKFYKISFWIAIISALIATAFNLVLIIGMGDLTSLLLYVINANSGNIAESNGVTLEYFLIFCGLLIVGYFINAFTNWLMNTLIIRISQKIGYKLRMDLFNKVQMLSVQYFDTHESGDIMSVLTNDVYNLVLFVSSNLGQILYGLTSMLGMLIIMFLVSPYISLIVIGLLLICFIAIFYLAKKSGPAFIQQQVELGKMNGFIEEIISGQNIVNLYSQQHTTEEQFKKINDGLTRDGEKSQSISGLMLPWLNFLMNFVIAFEMAIAFTFIINNIDFGSVITSISLVPDKTISPNAPEILAKVGIVTSLMLATRNFIQPINQMIGMIAQLQAAVAGSRRTATLFEQKNEVNKEETVDIVGVLKGKVEIKNLNFSYIEGKPILKNINLSVNPGETIAIVGPTGSGKTTIINLLTKFYDIKDGDIFLDKYDIKTVKKESIRKQVSIVLQDTYLFNTTVKENIRYAKQDATDEEIISAAKTAGCHDFIMQLEHQYDSILTENAQELSSGQKQLIAIARAMLSPSSILILDEATSNIDTRTEKVVQNAMLKLIKNKTAFVIAHRLSTIRNADKIVVLKDGEILEIGNHKELMKKKGFYYNLNMSKTDNLDIEKD